MRLFVIGLNHKTAPVELRERVAFVSESVGPSVQALASEAGLYETAILSTCNRTELYGTAISVHAGKRIADYFAASRSLHPSDLEPHLYEHRDEEAVSHLFRVAAGLDSLVMGEPQILGQVREAYELAHEAQTTGARLSRLFHSALEVGKLVRNMTALGNTPVSIATISLQLANRLLGELRHARILIIGAGEICETAAVLAADRDPASLTLINRTFERARLLAQKTGGRAVEWQKLSEELGKADLVLSGTGAPEPIISRQALMETVSGRTDARLVVIDMGLPRDVEAGSECMESVYLYDIDDLKGIAAEHLRQRMDEVPHAEKLVERATERYVGWLETLAVVPTIVDLRDKFEEIRHEEVRARLGKIPSLDEKGEQQIEQLTQAIVNKILHEPLVRLKRRSADHTGGVLAESIRHLFALDDSEDRT